MVKGGYTPPLMLRVVTYLRVAYETRARVENFSCGRGGNVYNPRALSATTTQGARSLKVTSHSAEGAPAPSALL